MESSEQPAASSQHHSPSNTSNESASAVSAFSSANNFEAEVPQISPSPNGSEEGEAHQHQHNQPQLQQRWAASSTASTVAVETLAQQRESSLPDEKLHSVEEKDGAEDERSTKEHTEEEIANREQTEAAGVNRQQQPQQYWHKQQQQQQQQQKGEAGGKLPSANSKAVAKSIRMLSRLCKCLLGDGPTTSSSVTMQANNASANKQQLDPEMPSTSKDGTLPRRRKKSSFLHSIIDRNPADAETQRRVRANDREFNAQFKYADNFIRTSKYTLLSFIPYNLYQQFTRIANFYFLILLLLQSIPQISSVWWVYTLVPLSFVLLCSAVKDGYDDLQRHRNDRQVNKRISYRVRNNRLVEEEWMHVKVGDIIRMENEHFIAADLLLLSTSEPHGICYIETAELDGETNLKTRAALPETVPMGDTLRDISAFDGEIICEPPNNRLDQFEGRLEWRGQVLPLDNKNMLLRGCRLRNTRWCYGLVVFAGKDTKLMRNSGESPMKRTSLDRFLNLLILGIVLFLFAMCLICTVMIGFWEHTFGRYFRVFLPWAEIVQKMKSATTLRVPPSITVPGFANAAEDDDRTWGPSQVLYIAALQFFSYMILLNTVVPISLYISVEMIRLAHSKFINLDMKMYYEKTDTPAKARTTTLNEELGQVQYVFSDKTGTLTQNIMIFKKCSINGRSYGDVWTERGEPVDIDEERMPGVDFAWNRWHEPAFRFFDQTLLDDTKRALKEVHEFWRLLAICHTVMPERKPGNVLEYQAQSPDEAALTSAARNFGFVFKSRTPQSITVEVNGREETYEVLHILDFDNVRKRMSVLVRSKSGKIKLYCKGADTMILERISARQTSELLRSATLQHLDKFARDGLRTLCVAWKPVPAEFCHQWMTRLKQARLDTQNKEQLLDALYEEMETDMLLLGATAIEDKLQDGVPQTIATLAAANIKLWVLTGDKTETAINIGYSCQLLTEDMREVFIIDGKEEHEVEVQLKDIKRRIESAKGAKEAMDVSSFYLPPRTPIRELSLVPDITQPRSPSTLQQNGIGGGRQSTVFPAEIVSIGSGTRDGKNAAAAVTFFPPTTPNGLTPPSPPMMANGVTWQNNDGESAPSGTDGGDGGYALVINGESLAHALKRKYEKTFLDIGCHCVSVICCRVTPLQKAQVVDLVKRNIKAVTLAIGDGANDVSMIRTAHIGVGISGQEGMQAVLSSDFSIGQFRYLERLLLVHGRWSYLRMCKFLRYFFYKNFAYTLTHFWYAFYCGFSAQTVYDPMLISLYNLIFTALPVLAMGIFEQDVSEQYSLRFPRLYIPGQFNLFFNMRIFIYSIIHGMISSLVLFFVPFGTLYHAIGRHGRDNNDYTMLAFTAFTALVLVVNGQIAFDTTYWTFWNWFVLIGSVLSYFLVVLISYQVLPIGWVIGLEINWHMDIVARAVSFPNFWLALLLICAILLLPVIAYRFFWFDTHPSYADRLQVRRKIYRDDELDREAEAAIKSRSKTAMASKRSFKRRGSLRSGYAFAHTTGFGELIAKGTLFKNLENLRIPSFHLGVHQHHGSNAHYHPHHRRSSLLKPFGGGGGNAASSSASSSAAAILLNPATLVIDERGQNVPGNGTSSVTQFSPGSANTITTTTLLIDSSRSNGAVGIINQKQPILPAIGESEGERRGTVDTLVIEHDDDVSPIDYIADDGDDEQMPIGSLPTRGKRRPDIHGQRVPTSDVGGNGTRLRAHSAAATGGAIFVPMREQPSPDLVNTAHKLVINAEDEGGERMPLPTTWRYMPDGTLYIPELEQPGNISAGTPRGSKSSSGSNSTEKATVPAKGTFSKLRPEIGNTNTKSSNANNSLASQGAEEGRTVQWMQSGIAAAGNHQAHETTTTRQQQQEQQKRIFTGKRRGTTTTNGARTTTASTTNNGKTSLISGTATHSKHTTQQQQQQQRRTPLPITIVAGTSSSNSGTPIRKTFGGEMHNVGGSQKRQQQPQ